MLTTILAMAGVSIAVSLISSTVATKVTGKTAFQRGAYIENNFTPAEVIFHSCLTFILGVLQIYAILTANIPLFAASLAIDAVRFGVLTYRIRKVSGYVQEKREEAIGARRAHVATAEPVAT